ncbi:MAG: helix-turn-helix domain-containing protein [Pseudonocardia sp.]
MIAIQPNQGPEESARARSGPTVLRIVLGTQLRRLREAQGISRQVASHAIRGSDAKISRLELGRVGFKQRDVADLLTLYGVVDAQERDAFLTLADQASTPGWWHKYSDVLPRWFETYVGLEQAAAVIRSYDVQFVPGLLQTEAYARAVIMLGYLGVPTADIDLRVHLRMARQDVLARPDAPSVWVVVDEAALRRPVGGEEVMRAQLDRLIELAELPKVTLQVVPFQAGGHSAAGGAFSILRFFEPEIPDIAYTEQLTSALYIDKKAEVSNYVMTIDRLCVEASTPADTKRLLVRIRKDT